MQPIRYDKLICWVLLVHGRGSLTIAPSTGWSLEQRPSGLRQYCCPWPVLVSCLLHQSASSFVFGLHMEDLVKHCPRCKYTLHVHQLDDQPSIMTAVVFDMLQNFGLGPALEQLRGPTPQTPLTSPTPSHPHAHTNKHTDFAHALMQRDAFRASAGAAMLSPNAFPPEMQQQAIQKLQLQYLHHQQQQQQQQGGEQQQGGVEQGALHTGMSADPSAQIGSSRQSSGTMQRYSRSPSMPAQQQEQQPGSGLTPQHMMLLHHMHQVTTSCMQLYCYHFDSFYDCRQLTKLHLSLPSALIGSCRLAGLSAATVFLSCGALGTTPSGRMLHIVHTLFAHAVH